MRFVAVDDDGKQVVLPAEAEVAEFVSENRKRRGMTLQAVADACEVSRQAVWSWEHNKSYPTIQKLVLLVGLFGSAEEPEKEKKKTRSSTKVKKGGKILQDVASILGS